VFRDQATLASCLICFAEIKYNGSTSTLTGHLTNSTIVNIDN
jgi:hypothetical protein